MSVSKIASAVMALSLVVVPTLGQAAPAASKLAVSVPTSATVARTGAPTVQGNKARGGGLIVALLAAAAVIAGIVIAADKNKTPTSA